MSAILIASTAAAQSSAADTSKPSKQEVQESQKSSSRGPMGVYNFLDEKSIVFPDIAVSTQPLTPNEKFQLFVDNSISLHTIVWTGLGSAIEQADDSPTGFGQGWDAYGKRFGSSMARGASSEFFGTFILASALHYDPRFFPEKDPSFGHAIGYSVSRVFVSRNDAGASVANIPGLLGPLFAEGLANAYWPDRNRTVGDTFLRYGLDLAARAGGNMFREYWPVVHKKFSHSASSRNAWREGNAAGQ